MEAEEFDDFYTASFDRVVAHVYAMIGDRDEALECVQEAFARAWSHRRKLDRAHAPEAWVRTTAYRLAVSRWRRAVSGRRDPDRALQARRQVDGISPDHVAVVQALQQIPEAQRRAVVLHHLCDLPVAAIAAETGVAEGTVKARLSRGRTALMSLLDDGTGMTERASHV